MFLASDSLPKYRPNIGSGPSGTRLDLRYIRIKLSSQDFSKEVKGSFRFRASKPKHRPFPWGGLIKPQEPSAAIAVRVLQILRPYGNPGRTTRS
jgi:hypothetical protein